MAVALLVAGCAPQYVWVRPDASQADFQRDVARCQYEAEAATANYGSNPGYAYSLGGAIGQGIGLGIGKATQQNKLAILCMRARGYGAELAGTVPVRIDSAPIAPDNVGSPPRSR